MNRSPINPFSSRAVRPGALAYRLPSAADGRPQRTWETVCRQLTDSRGWGEIIGPHGGGKSTFLLTLVAELERRDWDVAVIRLTTENRRVPRRLAPPAPDRSGLLAVDGLEQLSRWRRWRLARLCRRQGRGLLGTAHTTCGLPLLARCNPTLQQAIDLTWQLQARSPRLVAEADIRLAWERRRGNLREVFFDLYDVYERRRSR